jgi:NADPH-dependent 2,4-dienoyl-CoA reductase/sulfur reductase-like enzyme
VKNVVVIGGSLAGLSAARALRNQGFDGRLSILSAEFHRPYDRPPLSKSFLAGTASESDIALEAEGENLDADWRFGVTATALTPSSSSIDLSDGTTLAADGIVIATGATPRQLSADSLAGVHVLRTLDDAVALRRELLPGARLVVVGAGFIGAEVASTARNLGLDVTVIEAAPAPLIGALGAEMGAVVSALHTDHGVRLLCGEGVARLVGGERVEGVVLTDGRTVPADVVLVGVGVRPNTEWLSGSGLNTSNGVLCDAYGATGIPNVVAVGDCATWFDPLLGEHHRLEHWTGARERSAIAVRSLLSGGADCRSSRPPYFWSDQYGLTIQMAGHTRGADSVRVEEGSVDDRDFLTIYRRGDEPVAVLALGRGKSFMRWRRQLASRTLNSSAVSQSVPTA